MWHWAGRGHAIGVPPATGVGHAGYFRPGPRADASCANHLVVPPVTRPSSATRRLARVSGLPDMHGAWLAGESEDQWCAPATTQRNGGTHGPPRPPQVLCRRGWRTLAALVWGLNIENARHR